MSEDFQATPEHTPQAAEHLQEGSREKFGTSGVEYTVLLRRPDTDWDLFDGQVYPDLDAARAALAAAQERVGEAPAPLWAQLLRTPDSEFLPLAEEYLRLKDAQVALFARAVSAFVRAD